MKLEFNKKYTTIAIYAVMAVSAAAAIILMLVHLDQVKAIAVSLLKLLSPFIWGFALAYILNPILVMFEKLLGKIGKKKLSRKLTRVLSVLLTWGLALLILVVFFSIVIPQLISSIGSLAALFTAWINDIAPLVYQFIEDYDLQGFVAGIDSDAISKLLNTASDMVKGFSGYLTTAIPQLAKATASFASGILNIVLGIIISIYLMFSKELFFAHIKKFLYAFFPKKGVEKALEITHTSNRIFSGFISGKILDSCIIGVLCFIFMSLFRWPYAMLISVIVGVTNVIPYFGPFIGAIPSILILLIVDPKTAIFFAIFILALQQLDGNVIGPKILGDSTGLSAFWVIFSITVFGSLLGPLGMFIGVPLFAVIYTLVRQLSGWMLTRKGMSPDTKDYSSPDQPLFTRQDS